MRTVETDVLVIGSGFGAMAPALRLAEAGFSVTVVEKGPHIDPYTDFRQTQDPTYILRYLKSLPGDHLSLTYAEALGGGSGFYEMVSLRAPSAAFRQVDHNGSRLWPGALDRAILDPWYDRAERMLHVEQIAPELVPKSGLVFALMMKRLGYSCERAPYAVRGCLGSGFCVTGCIYGAKQSLLLNYLPQAVSAGASVETDQEVVEIAPLGRATARGAIPMARLPRRYAVLCRHVRTGAMTRLQAKVVVVAAGTVGTAGILLRSRDRLPRLSPEVGRNVAFNGSVKAAALLGDDLPDGDMFVGRSHPGMISYQFLASHGITISAAKPLPLQAVAAAHLRLDGDQRRPAWWGEPYDELMRRYRRRVLVLVTLGMTPPLGVLSLNGAGRLTPRLRLTEDLRAYHHEVAGILRHIMVANGCRPIEATFVDHEGAPFDDLHFSTAHQVGSCRMADCPSRGVVDPNGEVFGHPGLYVSDGAAIPSSLAVNTSLTILANAERVAAGILSRHGARSSPVAVHRS